MGSCAVSIIVITILSCFIMFAPPGSRDWSSGQFLIAVALGVIMAVVAEMRISLLPSIFATIVGLILGAIGYGLIMSYGTMGIVICVIIIAVIVLSFTAG